MRVRTPRYARGAWAEEEEKEEEKEELAAAVERAYHSGQLRT